MAVRTRRASDRAHSDPRWATLTVPAWARVRPHRGDDAAAHVTVTEPTIVTLDGVRYLCDELAQCGVNHIVTSAVDPAQAEPFIDAGFRVKESLVLLGRGLNRLSRPRHTTQRVRDRGAVTALDQLSFGDAALDDGALTDALIATPASRFRIVGPPEAPLGYAITGAAGWRGYVQRLAVRPDAQRRGIGTALLVDGLRWARRRGARSALVNTNVDNIAARALYESQGFVAFPVGLVVVELHQ
jgi:ribosomal protein S18 acetylase RimI-like enzyme